MSTRDTRKTFLAKLAGVVAAISVAPKLLAKPFAPAAKEGGAGELPISVRAEPRAVSRSSDSL